MTVINEQKTILLLYTETGGTHRNAAEAIQEAIHIQYPGKYVTKLVDLWQYSNWPSKYFPTIIQLFRARKNIVRWNNQFNSRLFKTRLFEWILKSFFRKMVERFLNDTVCDLIVSVHPLTAAPVIETMDKGWNFPFVVVVSDLASENIFWFHPDVDLLILPSDQTQKTAVEAGVDWRKTLQLGVPVGMNYCVKLESKTQIQTRLGLDPEKPVILLVGGKQGVGPIRNIAEQIDQEFKNISLVIIAGRNERLQLQLQGYNWNNSVIIQGYVKEMWSWMWAADLLISKAGTGMLAEALSVGLPMILFNRVPYLEDANVSFLVNQGAAIWAPTPKMVINGLNYWLKNNQERDEAIRACARLAKPDAAHRLADVLTEIADGKDVSEEWQS